MTSTEILAAIRATFNVTDADLTSGRRHRNVAEARTAAAYFMVTMANADRRDVARLFKRTTGWVGYCVYRLPDLTAADKFYAGRVNSVYRALAPVALLEAAA